MRSLRILPSLLALSAMAPCLLAQESEKSKGVPPSDSERVVLWKITLPDGQWVREPAREGFMLTIQHKDKTLGLVPVIKGKDLVAVEAFELVTLEQGIQVKKDVEQLAVPVDRRKTVNSRVVGGITVEGIGSRRGGGVTVGNCCITCGGSKACDCAILMSCGSCCVDPCCEKSPGGGVILESTAGLLTLGAAGSGEASSPARASGASDARCLPALPRKADDPSRDAARQ